MDGVNGVNISYLPSMLIPLFAYILDYLCGIETLAQYE